MTSIRLGVLMSRAHGMERKREDYLWRSVTLQRGWALRAEIKELIYNSLTFSKAPSVV